MLVLHGFSSSNYYNIAKLALLEKGLPFEEALVYSGAGDTYRPDFLEHSPLGKVPCLQTDEGYITESRCIVEYLERAYPENPLYPSSPFEVAKLLELTQVIDLYLELTMRRLLPNYFTRKPAPENIAKDVLATLTKGVKAVTQLARFDQFVLGDRFTAADIAATLHFPLVRAISRKVLDVDPLADVPGLLEYLKRMEQRPTVQHIRKDQAADQPAFFAHIQKSAP
ncbi:MAG TPA: glutathione S-transferase family protein [Polyangiales bacterium]|jgi:glutathione S-transferase|nr:glutathione S-transferase family protein [Polyangiales bacterium]